MWITNIMWITNKQPIRSKRIYQSAAYTKEVWENGDRKLLAVVGPVCRRLRAVKGRGCGELHHKQIVHWLNDNIVHYKIRFSRRANQVEINYQLKTGNWVVIRSSTFLIGKPASPESEQRTWIYGNSRILLITSNVYCKIHIVVTDERNRFLTATVTQR